jgi:hypothetical protein
MILVEYYRGIIVKWISHGMSSFHHDDEEDSSCRPSRGLRLAPDVRALSDVSDPALIFLLLKFSVIDRNKDEARSVRSGRSIN